METEQTKLSPEDQQALNKLHDEAMNECEDAFFHLRKAVSLFKSAHAKETEVFNKCDVEPSKSIVKGSADSIQHSLNTIANALTQMAGI